MIFHRAAPLLFCLMLLQALGTFWAAWERHRRLLTNIFDLAQFEQMSHAFWRTGVPLFTTLPPFEARHLLGFHFSPIVLSLTPLYALIPSPLVFQAAQSVLVALAAWPIYRAARAVGCTTAQGVLWSALYLFNPFTLNAAAPDFHEIAFAVPLMALGMEGLVARRRWRVLAACVGLILTKEQYGLTAAMFALAWGFRHGNWRYALPLAMLGVAVFALVNGVVMPYFRGEHMAYSLIAERYAWARLPWPDAGHALLATLLTSEIAAWDYVAALLLCFGGLPLLAPALLLPALPELALNLLATLNMPRSVQSYHSLPLIPVLAVAAAQVAAWPSAGIRRRAVEVGRGAALGIVFLLGWLAGPWPLPGNTGILRVMPAAYPPAADAVDAVRAHIPPDAKLSVQGNLAAHFAARETLVLFPARSDFVDTVVLHLAYPFEDVRCHWQSYPHIGDRRTYREAVQGLLAGREFGIAYWREPWLVMTRGTQDADLLARYEAQAALERVFRIRTGEKVCPF